jgi:hypothetical protein
MRGRSFQCGAADAKTSNETPMTPSEIERRIEVSRKGVRR